MSYIVILMSFQTIFSVLTMMQYIQYNTIQYNAKPYTIPYTAKNATDLLQVVSLTNSLQLVNKLQQACQFHQVATSLLKSGLLQFVICRLVTTCWNNLQQTCW